jgi:hypothetical protein
MAMVLYTFLEDEAEEELILSVLLDENKHDMYKENIWKFLVICLVVYYLL